MINFTLLESMRTVLCKNGMGCIDRDTLGSILTQNLGCLNCCAASINEIVYNHSIFASNVSSKGKSDHFSRNQVSSLINIRDGKLHLFSKSPYTLQSSKI